MRNRITLGLGLLGILLVAVGGCGGGGGAGGGGGLNVYEQALVGDYVLDGFDVYLASTGLWYDETNFASWAGTLSLFENGYADQSVVIEGVAANNTGHRWSATAITLSDDTTGETGGYTWDGTHLVTDFTNPVTGDREIDSWVRTP